MFGFRFRGRRYYCGGKVGFLLATLDFGQRRFDLSDEILAYINPMEVLHKLK